MDIRLITVREDFEKAYRILNQKEYPLSFYEFTLKHDQFTNKTSPKLIGVFVDDKCIGYLSYVVKTCPVMDRILEIQEIKETNIKSYKALMSFIDILAKDENCNAIKISKNDVSKLDQDIFDKFENFLKNLVH